MTYYIVMGGKLESYGWFEWIQTPYPFDDDLVFNFDEIGNPVKLLFNFVLTNPGNNRRNAGGSGSVHLDDAMKLPWLLAGMERLSITFQDAPEDIITVANDTQ